jgi:hypothetical protein
MVLDDGGRQVIAAIVFGSLATILVFGWMLGFDARSLRYAWGAAGEKWTAEALEKLPATWQVFHDLPEARGNWDHIAVGPSGIFLIDSKNLSEPALVDDSGLRAGRLRYGGSSSRGAAVRLKEAIAHETGRTFWVQSVLAVWGTLEGGMSERDRVLYVPGQEIVAALQARPRRMSESDVAEVARAIETIRDASA